MNRILTLMIGLVLSCSAALHAQQEPLFAQYNNNFFLINPAVAGSKGNHSFNLFHRWQWVTFPGAPQTFGLTYQGMFKGNAGIPLHGVGALLFGDVTGPSARWGGKVSYAFHLPLADRKMRLSFGPGFRIAHNVLRTNEIHLINPNDQAIVNGDQGITVFDVEFGLYLYTKRLRVGLSAPNLLQTRIDYGSSSTGRDPIGSGYRHYFLSGAYKIPLPAQKIILEPSVLIKYVQGTIPQIDGGVTLYLLEEQLSFGLYYRSPAFLSFQSKFLFDKRIPVLIGFDIALNNFQQHSIGSTELMIGYEMPAMDMFEPLENPEDKGDL